MSYNQYPSNMKVQNNGWKLLVFGAFMFGFGALVGGIVGVFVFIRITGGTGEPSTPISAPTLSIQNLVTPTEIVQSLSNIEPTLTLQPNSTPQFQPATSPTTIPPQPVRIIPTATLVQPTVIRPTDTLVPPTPTNSPPRLFRIVSEESEARFSVFETFPLGTAIGRTNQVAGDIIVNFNNPSNSQIGEIRINVRTLKTDDPDRDRSIRCCVLLSAQDIYEFADFVPTAITGLPDRVQVGERVSFQVTGNLTLRGITRPVTFTVSLTLTSPSEIRAVADATVNRSDFGILNNSENGFDYHGVEESVSLSFDFVAREVVE